MIAAFAFYLFAAVVVISALLTITARNPVHSVLWLILAFFNAAGLMVLCGAEFIAMLLVIVYVGAVAVLFLFVVMMLNIDFSEMRQGFTKYLPFGLLIAGVLIAETLIAGQAWSAGGIALSNRAAPSAANVANIEQLGLLIYTRYLFIFEAAGLVLLVALIGAIVLTHRERGGVKAQRPGRQVMRPSAGCGEEYRPAGRGGSGAVTMTPSHRHPGAGRDLNGSRLESAVVAVRRLGPGLRRGDGGTVMIGLQHYLAVSAILFVTGVLGIFINRKNLIVILMSIELILLGVNINLVAFSAYLHDLVGQVFAMFVLTVAAGEAAIGLAILVIYFRGRATISVDDVNRMRG